MEISINTRLKNILILHHFYTHNKYFFPVLFHFHSPLSLDTST